MARSPANRAKPADPEVGIRAAQIGLAHLDFVVAVLELHRALVLQLDILVIERELGEIGVHGNRIRLEKRAGDAEAAHDLAMAGHPAEMQGADDQGIEIDLRNHDFAGKRISAVQIHAHVAVQLSRSDRRIHL